jgi:hypothetical protein
MPSCESPARIQAEIRRAQQKARQVGNDHNRQVDKYDAARRRAIGEHNAGKVNQAIDRYNRDARTHNPRVRANRGRLARELRRLQSNSSQKRTVVRVEYRISVTTLAQAYSRPEAQADTTSWAGTDVLDYGATESANSVAALNGLLGESPSVQVTDEELAELQRTNVEEGLEDLDPNLGAGWRGALFALHPENPMLRGISSRRSAKCLRTCWRSSHRRILSNSTTPPANAQIRGWSLVGPGPVLSPM